MKWFVLILILASGPRVLAQHVWIEGEDPTASKVNRNRWYSSVNESRLSGGGWLSHFGKTVGEASYDFSIPKEGVYRLWLHANPVKTKLSVRIDREKWESVEFSKQSTFDRINVAKDNKPDLRYVAWQSAGDFALSAGTHSVAIRLHSSNNNHGALDCFCFVADLDWKPSGTLRPGEARPHWRAPKISDANLDKWMRFVQPGADELGWQQIRWHRNLSEAAAEAKELNRPLLLWAMNGHPCGET